MSWYVRQLNETGAAFPGCYFFVVIAIGIIGLFQPNEVVFKLMFLAGLFGLGFFTILEVRKGNK